MGMQMLPWDGHFWDIWPIVKHFVKCRIFGLLKGALCINIGTLYDMCLRKDVTFDDRDEAAPQ